MTLDHVKYFAVPLPEDIQRQEDAGFFQKARELINQRLSGPVPQALRERLELELLRIPQLEGEYPFSYEQALHMLTEEIRDFTKAGLDLSGGKALFCPPFP